MKGLSPLSSVILVISSTVTIGLAVSVFYTSFAKTTTTSVSGTGKSLITCTDSYPTVTLVRYPASGSGVMSVLFANPGNDILTNITIYTAMSASGVYANSSGSLNALSSNATQLFNINGLGTPTEVRVVGVCSGQAISGSCLIGQACMKAV